MTLTARELHVLYGLAAGLTLTELAGHMGIRSNTARRYRKHAGSKLGDGNVVRLLRSAVATGHLPPDVLSMPTHVLLKKVPRGKGVSAHVQHTR